MIRQYRKTQILVPLSETMKIASVYYTIVIVTARCTLVQDAVLRSHVVCLSVRL